MTGRKNDRKKERKKRRRRERMKKGGKKKRETSPFQPVSQAQVPLTLHNPFELQCKHS